MLFYSYTSGVSPMPILYEEPTITMTKQYQVK